MSQMILFVELLLVHYAVQTQIEVNCRENVTLMCPDVDFNNLNFISMTWYKIHNQKRKGIIRRLRQNKTIQHYNFTRPVRFGEEYNLFMPSVTPEDSGTYECGINANVGGQSLNREIKLTVGVCDTQTQATPMTTVTTESNTIQKQVVELPVMWGVTGYLVLGFTKVILCLITIWVIRSSTTYCSTRRSQIAW